MPGSVQNASPATVLPWSLCKAFTRSQDFPVLENEYANGESQRSRLADTSRKSWKTARRLAPSVLQTFRDFCVARNGPHEAFYFYDPWDTNPKFSYDPTGVETVGRYTVRFEGTWEQMAGMGRADVDISLLQLA